MLVVSSSPPPLSSQGTQVSQGDQKIYGVGPWIGEQIDRILAGGGGYDDGGGHGWGGDDYEDEGWDDYDEGLYGLDWE